MVVDINGGHGPFDIRGFKQVDNLNECSEGVNNFRIYELVRKGLEKYENVTITTVRPNLGDNPPLATRGASGKGADLQLHLHSNAGGGRGPEIILRPDASDEAVSLAKDIRANLMAIGNLPKRDLKFPIPGANYQPDWKTTRGPGRSYFAELRYSEAKIALLVEMSFHDNDNEASLLRKKRQEYADAIVSAIVAFYKLSLKTVKQDRLNGPYTNEAEETLYFRAIEGSYKTRAEAMEAVDRMVKEGRKAWLHTVFVKED